MEIKDIENLAELAKIDLSLDEKESLLKDLDGILGYVKQISEVKTEEDETEYSIRNVWREDESRGQTKEKENEDESNKNEKSTDFDASREKIVSQFPDSKDGFVKVKKIL